MAPKTKFKYRGGERTVEDVSRRAKHSSGLYDTMFADGFTPFKPKEGENQIRIMPLTWEDVDKWGTSWEIMVFVHNNIGPDRGTFLCLDKMNNEPCPICEARRSAVDDEERYALAPNERALCWLIDRNDEKAGPQLWSMPIKTVFKAINAGSIKKKTGALMLIDDPESGHDVFFNVEGAGKKTASYTGVTVDPDETPLADKEATEDKWLDYIQENPLPEVLNFQDADYINKVLSGRVAKKSDDEEDEDNVAPRRAARRPRSEPEEEEEKPSRSTARRRPSEEAEEEAEADPPPRRSRARAEPEEEEEEAEAEAPSGRRAGKRSSPEPEEEEVEDKPAGRRRVAKEPEEEEEHDSETGELPPRRTTRRRAEPEEEEEIPAESKRARAGLEKLRPRK